MGLIINHALINDETGKVLQELCPFEAILYENGKLEINSACRLCKVCVNNGPEGCITYQEDEKTKIDKSLYKGICVYADSDYGKLHNVTFELLGKAKQLAKVIDHPVYALLIGYHTQDNINELLEYGADKVYVYDHEKLKDFDIERYANCFSDFIEKIKPSSILVGATNTGRSLAPRVAARFNTGLTADCTKLEMKENSDLVQIRPAFGGNIMAQIITPDSRPQFCTVRYKIFDAPEKVEKIHGEAVLMNIKDEWLDCHTQIVDIVEKPKEMDISEADVIVAVGRGLKSKNDLAMIEELATLLNANIACSRPMVENGTFDARHQIGLSGKTVKQKLIITLGISGTVQFVSGMKNSDCIIAINSDPDAQIFNIAHYGIVGDLYQIVPQLIDMIKENKDV